jgi:hypothetical protein
MTVDERPVVPLRRYGVRAIYDGFGAIARRAPGQVVAAAAAGFVVTASVLVAAGPPTDLRAVLDDGKVDRIQISYRVGAVVLGSLSGLGVVAVTALLVPLTLRLVASGRPVGAGTDLRHGGRAAAASVAVAMLGVPAELVTLVSHGDLQTIMLAVGVVAIWLQIQLSLAPAAAAAEGLRVGASLRRSRDLVRGRWWRTYGTFLATDVAGLLQGAFLLVVGVVDISRVSHHGHGIDVPTREVVLLGALLTMLSIPMTVTGRVLFYIDCRCRDEGLAWRLVDARRDPTAAVFGGDGAFAASPLLAPAPRLYP